jgi:hypothetical protein
LVWAFESLDGKSFAELIYAKSLSDCKLTPGSYYCPENQRGSKLYVHLTNGERPDEKFIMGSWGYEWKLDGLEYITFKNITFRGSAAFDFNDNNNPGRFLKWEGCTISHGNHSIFRLRYGIKNIEIINCDISKARNGIYNTVEGNPELGIVSYYTYRGNYIHDIGNEPRIYDTDAHAIGIQSSADGLIENNHITDCDSGIVFWYHPYEGMKNNVVRYNYIEKNIETKQTFAPWGIGFSGDNGALGDLTGNLIYGNVVKGWVIGLRGHNHENVLWFNNTVVNCNYGYKARRSFTYLKFKQGIREFKPNDLIKGEKSLATAKVDNVESSGASPDINGMIGLKDLSGDFLEDERIILQSLGSSIAVADGGSYTVGPSATLKNNIFLNSKDQHISFAGGPSVTFVLSHNIYFPDGSTKFFKNNKTFNFSEWQSIGHDDTGSKLADPKLDSNLIPQKDSPAIDSGTSMGIDKDIAGNSIVGYTDIGAYEFTDEFKKIQILSPPTNLRIN